MLTFYILLFILGWVFWSFSSVLIERWKSGKWGIMFWRSECPKCHHILWVHELIPLVSYIFQRWRCSNCTSEISLFYPFAEIFFGLLFTIMGYISISFWNDPVSWETWVFLLLGFITGIYMLYDIRYMEIPDQIMVPSIVWYIILLLLWSNFREYLFDSSTYHDYQSLILDHFYAAVMIYSFFYLQILIPSAFFLLKRKKMKQFIQILYSYFLFPIELIFSFFIRKNTLDPEPEPEEEIPVWIWAWDLRVAIFIWLTLWGIHTLSTLFFAYIIGSIVGWFLLFQNKSNHPTRNHQIPFWPFLWIGWILSLIFYTRILNFF